ncbi:PLP-dependent aminotransferase family protein [uncultured Cohaesibacter sp.]|uniref:aminotransferase-like domain-containing protein n=1 Tax=uncultured Cohaesibacter sp. TaxID=1002546 RepID=UPI002AAB35E0|nr:PLP-dependent aminotransferase family protein [uncultured Cohaesibacter sp.]
MRTKFRKVVAELAQDIQTGKLVPGDRLPTHRELAYRFGLSLGTATRVFAELEAMGLTVGEVGRGTFVRMQGEGRAVDFALADPDQSIVDFSLNRFILPEQEAIFAGSVARVLADKGCDSLDYRNSVGAEYDRYRIADWLNDDREGTPFDLAQLTICSGGQHALMLALMSACHAGQAVVVEDYTYPVVRLACEMLHLDVVTVESDEEGICPASLDALCEDEGVRMLFTMPNVQNPTSVTMSVKRRHAIADVLKKRNILALEDDAYGFLLEQPPVSLCDLAPDHVFYSRTLSKSWAPGLRICYLVAPKAFSRQIDKAQRATVWMSAPLMVSVATELVATGHYEAVVSLKRREIAKRQKIVRRVLGDLDLITDPRSMHVMLKLPSGIRTGEFLAALKERNVVASPLRQFVASCDCVKVPEGIRLCIGSPSNRKSLEEALVCVHKALRSFDAAP